MNCPVCDQPMQDSSQIGEYCCNDACPVLDDADLWYKNSNGEWRCQRWVEYKKEGNRTLFRLSKKEE